MIRDTTDTHYRSSRLKVSKKVGNPLIEEYELQCIRQIENGETGEIVSTGKGKFYVKKFTDQTETIVVYFFYQIEDEKVKFKLCCEKSLLESTPEPPRQ